MARNNGIINKLYLYLIAGVHPIPLVSGVGGRIQLRPRLRVLPASLAHMPRVRDAGTEPLRLPQTEQVLSSPSEVYQADTAASTYGAAEVKSE